MLESGSSVSLVQSDILSQTDDIVHLDASRSIRLATASGNQLPIVTHVRTLVALGVLKLLHEIVVVESLVVPVIMDVDFLQENGLVLDFAQRAVGIHYAHTQRSPATYPEMYEAERKITARASAVTALDRSEMTDADAIDDCVVPKYAEPIAVERTKCSLPCHNPVIRKYEHLFCTTPGCTKEIYEFKRMPFGFSGAPSSFQRLMDTVLRGLPFVTI